MLTCQKKLQKNDIYTLIIVIVVLFGCLIWIQQTILQNFFNSADEFNYYYQGTLFAAGKISTEAHPYHEALSPFYIIEHQSRAFSIFPPGWPFLLAVGVKLGLAELINPIVSVTTVLLLYGLTHQLFGRLYAWLAILIFVTSPFFLFNSASYFAHPACLFWIMLSALFIVLAYNSDRRCFFIGAGISAAMAFATRELTTVALLTAPVYWVIFRQKRHFQVLGLFILGALPICIIYLIYNAALVGEWFVPVRFLQEGEIYGFGERTIKVFDYETTQYFGPKQAFYFTSQNIAALFSWTFLGMPLFALIGVWDQRKNGLIVSFALSILFLMIAYFFYPTSSGNNQYGPRFYYESLGFLSCLSAIGIMSIARFLKLKHRFLIIFMLGLGLISLLNFSVKAVSISEQIYERRTLERFVERRELDNALIFVAGPSGDMFEGDLIRNLPGFEDDKVIYAWNLGPRNEEIMKAFPEKNVYIFEKNQRMNTYSLTRLRSTLGEAN